MANHHEELFETGSKRAIEGRIHVTAGRVKFHLRLLRLLRLDVESVDLSV
jgi:hypothetical protein